MNDQFLQGVLFDWNRIDNDSYLKRIKAFKGIEKLVFNKPITFFVGENGSGKSTLLEALAVAHGFNPEGGTKNYVFSTHDTHSELCDAIRISKGYRKEKWGYFLRAESFYNVATKEEEYADLTHPSAKYHEKSHGESFLALAQNNLRPNGLYLFDEPEAALSPQRQLTLLMQIYSCAKEGAQFIIVTHSYFAGAAQRGHIPLALGLPEARLCRPDGFACPPGCSGPLRLSWPVPSSPAPSQCVPEVPASQKVLPYNLPHPALIPSPWKPHHPLQSGRAPEAPSF